MRKVQVLSIEKFNVDKIIKIIDEGFENEVIIYVQTSPSAIMEYEVSALGTIKFSHVYNTTPEQQRFFDSSPTLQEYLQT